MPATGQSIPLVGLDLIADHPEGFSLPEDERTGTNSLAQNLTNDNVWVSSRLGARSGTQFRSRSTTRSIRTRFGACSRDSGDAGGLILMDIATAQRALKRANRVDRILITVPVTPSVEQWEQRLRAVVPAGVELRRQGSETTENRKMLSAFRWNLRILSYVALVVGAFLIFNTISVSVVRRRPEIGIARALGASRTAVLSAFLGEAACFGVVGGLVGIVLGRLLAIGAVRLLGATVDNLYVSSTPAPIQLTPLAVLFGLAIGVGVSLASAASPAHEASLVAPVEAMARGEREYATRVHKIRDLWIGFALAIVGAAASFAPAIAGKPFFGYAAALLFIAACAFAIPALVSGLTAISSGMLRAARRCRGDAGLA